MLLIRQQPAMNEDSRGPEADEFLAFMLAMMIGVPLALVFLRTLTAICSVIALYQR